MTQSEQFKQDRYLDIKHLIPKDLCNIATKYALMQSVVDFSPEEDADAQVKGAHSKYSDTLMETIMYFLHPKLEKILGLDLCPTYTYYRVYRPGQELKRHKDRPSCEISTTICLGYNYLGTEEDYSWGMFVDKDSYKIDIGENGEFFSNNQSGKMIKQAPGDGIAYRGCEIEHWREPFNAGDGSYQVQLFCHFINKDGPYYPEYKYDKRPGLGYKR